MKVLGTIGVMVLATASIVATASDSAFAVDKGSKREAILAVQVQLDRAAFPVGEIDGRWGANTERAIRAFQRAHDLAPSGTVDDATAAALGPEVPALVAYTITADDVAGPFVAIPKDMMAKAKVPAAGFSSPLEMFAERSHASPALLSALNPGKAFDATGTEVMVPNVGGMPPRPPAKSVVVDGSDLSVQVLDEQEKVIARYPASVGSVHDPLPVGEWTIKGVARNPKFHYDPDLFWDADRADTAATIPPGPNNPVGVVWIDLSKEHYGIHGTPEPSRISRSESHGCIRLTNWDAATLAEQVKPGTPAVLRK